MTETVTTNDAIKKAEKMLSYPMLIIFFGLVGLSFYLVIMESMPAWIIPVGFLISFTISVFYWSFMITKWKLWAFENAQNVHELKKRAIQEKLIRADDHILTKIEIWNSAQREKWNSLQPRFNEKDIFKDNFAIPNETIIYYAKGKILMQMIIWVACIGVGIYLIPTNSYLIGIGISLAGAFFGFKEYKKINNREPQIILNEKGIQTISTEFHNWTEINNDKVIREGFGKETNFYLVYNHTDGEEKIKIDDYDIDQKKLNELLNIYRERNKKRNN